MSRLWMWPCTLQLVIVKSCSVQTVSSNCPFTLMPPILCLLTISRHISAFFPFLFLALLPHRQFDAFKFFSELLRVVRKKLFLFDNWLPR